jgi:hypothetical protein
MSNPEISLVKNTDIDYQKWDHCVQSSGNFRVYAISWYLDIVSPNWAGLIWGDYLYVMPLVIKQKFGIAFLLQPIFAQQHGIFPEANQNIQSSFLNFIHDQFRYVNINLNSSHARPFPEGFFVQEKPNFVLSLVSSYNELKKNYSKHTVRQIRKAEDNKVSVNKGLTSNAYLDLKNSVNKNSLPKQSMQTLKRLIEYGNSHGNGEIYAAYNQNNALCAAAFFFFTGQRAIYLNAVSSEEGKRTNAMHKIVDQFIQDHSGSPMVLDFEGSMIPGIARFYEGFGAKPEQYYCLKLNKLPIPFRWFKKADL